MKHVALFARVIFGLVFVAASIDKILHPQAFASIIANYRILPDLFVSPAAIWLPWVELVCGLSLIAGRLGRGAALVLNALMVLFVIVLLFNLARGLDVACGCFSTADGQDNTALALARDAAILLLGLVVLRNEIFPPQRS